MLDAFFRPQVVAVVGASRQPGKVGYDVVKNLLDYRFPGKIYPVNPKASEILGLPCYSRVTEIPEKVDLAIIAVPAPLVPSVLKDCASQGIRAAVILSAGFRESGAEGARLEREVLSIARENGIRILGPNCLGVVDTYHRLNATFAAIPPRKGRIGFFSQSGALCLAVLEWARAEGVGLSRFVSLGNKSDVSEIECLQALAEDPHTEVILGYVEGIDEGRTFVEVARRISYRKPIVIFKGGLTAAGARAASSHTGSLAGSEVAYRAAFQQAGVLWTKNLREFFNLARFLALQPLPQGPRLVVITNSGGPGIIAADACERSALELPSLSGKTVKRLRRLLPPHASFYNPVDLLGDADEERYFEVLKVLTQEKEVDALLVILSRTATIDPLQVARGLKEFRGTKPLAACFIGEETLRATRRTLLRSGIPPFEYPEEAVQALEKAWLYTFNRSRPPEEPVRPAVDFQRARSILEGAREAGRSVLLDHEVQEVLMAYGFRFPKSLLARTTEEAVLAARVVGYPVVLKIVSPEILHKTDVGGVKTNLRDEKELRQAFLEITTNVRRRQPGATILGVLVQEMIEGGREVILGFTRDHQFGPLVMFGLGGIYVEVLKDVSFRLAPLTLKEAREMIRKIRSYPLLKGIRGAKEADLEALAEALVRFSFLVSDFPELTEGEINPLMVRPRGKGVVAVDARLLLGGLS
ncbi:CoA-binding protein [Thermosulfurimonas marina]|uniref:CoA-binding protein n=1 Tax=Thermosulfurimonas marina TaxID=2047767 RepID=A0A6H1WPX6_9BACT|nr:acetate--CoA ligase [Thermosulfurimonas marina]QJA05277.1 CoA-binding protein [Thermosulfurimonas marina]